MAVVHVPDDNRESYADRNKKQGDTEGYAKDGVLKTSVLIDGHKNRLRSHLQNKPLQSAEQ